MRHTEVVLRHEVVQLWKSFLDTLANEIDMFIEDITNDLVIYTGLEIQTGSLTSFLT